MITSANFIEIRAWLLRSEKYIRHGTDRHGTEHGTVRRWDRQGKT